MAKDLIVGLDGYAGVGKDFAAEILAEYGFMVVDLAIPLKELLIEVGFPVEHWDENGNDEITPIGEYVEKYGWTEAKKNKRVRLALQGAGGWVKKHAKSNHALMDFFENGVGNDPRQHRYVITNARREGEKSRIRALGGCIIRVNKEGHGPVNDDVTEQRLGGFEFEVSNDGDREFLRPQLVACVEKWYQGVRLEPNTLEEAIRMDMKLLRPNDEWVTFKEDADDIDDGTDPIYEDGTEVEQ